MVNIYLCILHFYLFFWGGSWYILPYCHGYVWFPTSKASFSSSMAITGAAQSSSTMAYQHWVDLGKRTGNRKYLKTMVSILRVVSMCTSSGAHVPTDCCSTSHSYISLPTAFWLLNCLGSRSPKLRSCLVSQGFPLTIPYHGHYLACPR